MSDKQDPTQPQLPVGQQAPAPESTDDLADFLIKLRAWWDKNGTFALAVILVVVAGFVGYRWYTGQQYAAHESAWGSYYAASTPEDYLKVADLHGSRDSVGALARLAAADALLSEAIVGKNPFTSPTTPETESPDPTTQIEEAIGLYKHIIETTSLDASQPSLVVLRARFGLATAYEQTGKIAEAREQYETVVASAGDYQLMSAQAKNLLSDLDKISTPVTFPEQDVIDALQDSIRRPDSPATPAPASPDSDTTIPATQPATDTPEPTPTPAE